MPSKPDSNRPWNSADEPIELAAAEWLVRQDRGLDRAQQRDFERWLQADPRHAQAYANLKETWRQLDHVPAHRLPVPPHRGRRVWSMASSLAAAAAIALVFLRPSLGLSSRGIAQHTTPIGGFEQLALPDGSTVRLNTASEVSVAFSAQERRVLLVRGEASFEVAKDPARPFIVRVGEVDVRAVGTVFHVRQRDRAIEVLVTEGRVRVDDAVSGQSLLAIAPETLSAAATSDKNDPAPPVLAAGQRVVIVRPPAATPAPAQVAKVAPDETARALAWHNRQLEFSNEPLVNIAAEFNRYNPHQLVVADPELAAQRFGGKFPADDFASLVRLLETNFNVVVEQRGNETVLRRAAGRP